jgi:teichuronic acid biosynthesis glycosyltransferase TuaG
VRCPVSVVIPCYRCADTIARALDSISQQTWLPEEIILVDDASDDGGATKAAIEAARASCTSSITTTFVALENNGGPAVARNVAWQRATQAYIAFLDADDAWHPQKLELQMRWMLENPNIDICGHASRTLSPNARFPPPNADWSARAIEPMRMLWSNPLATRGVVLKRELPYRFPETMRYAEDYFLWLSIAFAGYKTFVSPSVLAFSFKADYGEAGLTKNLWIVEKCELQVYQRLRRAGNIGWCMALAARGWSLLRYVRRVVISTIRALSVGWR